MEPNYAPERACDLAAQHVERAQVPILKGPTLLISLGTPSDSLDCLSEWWRSGLKSLFRFTLRSEVCAATVVHFRNTGGGPEMSWPAVSWFFSRICLGDLERFLAGWRKLAMNLTFPIGLLISGAKVGVLHAHKFSGAFFNASLAAPARPWPAGKHHLPDDQRSVRPPNSRS